MLFSVFLFQASGISTIMSVLPLVAMFVVFYFFMIRPQMNRAKLQTKFQTDLEKGQEIVTSSGIIGKITSIQGNIISLQLSDKVIIRVLRNAVSKDMTDAFASGKVADVVPTV